MSVDENKLKIQHVSNEEIERWNSISQSVGTGQSSKVTYDELIELINDNKLKPNNQYVLIDYKTKYRQPVTNVIKESEEIERLVLTAISESQISPVVASLDYPKDFIFYDVDDNVCEDSETPRKGFIQRRVDTVNLIDIPYDWRTMLWARFKGTAPTWTTGQVTREHIRRSGNNLYIVIRTGIPTSVTDENFFQLLCSTEDYFFTGIRNGTGLTLNMEDYAERYTFNASDILTEKSPIKAIDIQPRNIVMKNTFLQATNNKFSNESNNNVFMFNSLSDRPRNMSFGTGCYGNTFRIDCWSNTFGDGCCNNIFAGGLINCTFGSFCSDNIFVGRSSTNTFGSHYWRNISLGSFSFNTFGSNCQTNIYGNNFSNSTFRNTCYSNTFGNNCNVNSFGDRCGGNYFANHFTHNNLNAGVLNRNMSNISILHNNLSTITILNVGSSVVAHHYATTTAVNPTITQIP